MFSLPVLISRFCPDSHFPGDNCEHSTATVAVNCSNTDDSAVKVGMLAVERAVKSMTAELSVTSNRSEGKYTCYNYVTYRIQFVLLKYYLVLIFIM